MIGVQSFSFTILTLALITHLIGVYHKAWAVAMICCLLLLSLDVQKAYDSVWRNGPWFKLWEFGVRGKMRRVIKKMYEYSKSAVLFDGERSEADVEQGVASISPILFSVFINGLSMGC